jgi:hypothetical protein
MNLHCKSLGGYIVTQSLEFYTQDFEYLGPGHIVILDTKFQKWLSPEEYKMYVEAADNYNREFKEDAQ